MIKNKRNMEERFN